MLCYLGLLFVASSQELHDYNVGFGHLQDTVHLLLMNNNRLIMEQWKMEEHTLHLGLCNAAGKLKLDEM